MTDKKEITCPNCGATCCTEMSDGKNCNQCGHRWDKIKTAIPRSTRDSPANGYQNSNSQQFVSLIPPQKK
jgi:hypothetical protein